MKLSEYKLWAGLYRYPRSSSIRLDPRMKIILLGGLYID